MLNAVLTFNTSPIILDPAASRLLPEHDDMKACHLTCTSNRFLQRRFNSVNIMFVFNALQIFSVPSARMLFPE